MNKRYQQWLEPPIEQFSYEGVDQIEVFKGSSIPRISVLIKAAVTKQVFVEDKDDDSEASFYGDDDLAVYTSSETEPKEIEPAQYRFQCSKVFILMRTDGATISLLEWIVDTYNALEFDAMFRLLGHDGFVRHMIEVQASSLPKKGRLRK